MAPQLVTRFSTPDQKKAKYTKVYKYALDYDFAFPEKLDWNSQVNQMVSGDGVALFNFGNNAGEVSNFSFLGFPGITEMFDPARASRIEIGFCKHGMLRALKLWDVWGYAYYETHGKINTMYQTVTTIEEHLVPGERWIGVRGRQLAHTTPASLLDFQLIFGKMELNGVVLNHSV